MVEGLDYQRTVWTGVNLSKPPWSYLQQTFKSSAEKHTSNLVFKRRFHSKNIDILALDREIRDFVLTSRLSAPVVSTPVKKKLSGEVPGKKIIPVGIPGQKFSIPAHFQMQSFQYFSIFPR